MSHVRDGGAAFPNIIPERHKLPLPNQGLSKREWFAGKAIASLGVEDYDVSYVSALLGIEPKSYNADIHWPMFVAQRAYKIADAMIAEGKK